MRVRGGGRAMAAAAGGRTVAVRRWQPWARGGGYGRQTAGGRHTWRSSGTSGPGRWPRSGAEWIDTSMLRSGAAQIHRRPDLVAVVVAVTSGRWLRRDPEQRRGGVGLDASAVD
jgi:hypothetical protein